MPDVLIVLKRLLNSIEEKELQELDLWIDAENTISAIVYDNNSITLITNTDKLKIERKGMVVNNEWFR